MPRKKKVSGKRIAVLPEVWAWLNDEGDGWLEVYLLSEAEKKNLWEEHEKEILDSWIEKKPCSRPEKWWDYSAPKDLGLLKGTHWEGTYPIGRKLLSGKGCADFVKTPAYLPRFKCGLPVEWHEYDPSDAPTFESEAAYLKRFNLLTASEKKFLDKNPALLEPVIINYE